MWHQEGRSRADSRRDSNLCASFAAMTPGRWYQGAHSISNKDKPMNTPYDPKRMTTFGIIAIILGFLCMAAPIVTGLSIALLLGVLVLVAGVVRLVWAFQAGSLGEGILKFLLAGLTLVCGLLLVANPLFAAGFLTILLSLYFIVDGVSEI